MKHTVLYTVKTTKYIVQRMADTQYQWLDRTNLQVLYKKVIYDSLHVK